MVYLHGHGSEVRRVKQRTPFVRKVLELGGNQTQTKKDQISLPQVHGVRECKWKCQQS